MKVSKKFGGFFGWGNEIKTLAILPLHFVNLVDENKFLYKLLLICFLSFSLI